jgi:hypothetical protein
MQIKKIYFEDMDHSAVYVHSSNLKGLISSHRSRPIYKITFNNKYILRKVRAKAVDGLDSNSVIIDHISMIELKAENGGSVTFKKASFWQRWFAYYYLNPIEELRGAWWYFMIGQFLVGFHKYV